MATADGGGEWEYVGPQTGLVAGQEVEEENACGVTAAGAQLITVSAFLRSLLKST